MNRLQAIDNIRENLNSGRCSIGSWMQIPHASVAEIIGASGYDWVAIDMEHGAISTHQLPDIFRALELGETLPLVRIAQGLPKDCKQALDAGAGGVIVPMIESASQLRKVRDACRWPSAGNRGVAFSRANLFGEFFKSYTDEAQQPLIIAMIENIAAVKNIEDIVTVKGLDAILIGPYDLSASMGLMAEFDNPNFIKAIETIKKFADKADIPCGIHVVEPSVNILKDYINSGYRFIAYSMDAVFLNQSARRPRLP